MLQRSGNYVLDPFESVVTISVNFTETSGLGRRPEKKRVTNSHWPPLN